MHSIWEYQRNRSIELLREGERPASIAHFLGVSCGSVRKWQRMARDGENLARKPIPGRPRRLTEDQLAHLAQLLSLDATDYGWPKICGQLNASQIWSRSTLERSFAEAKYGISSQSTWGGRPRGRFERAPIETRLK